MSALGHKQTCALQLAMSAKGQKRTRAMQLAMSAMGQKLTFTGVNHRHRVV